MSQYMNSRGMRSDYVTNIQLSYSDIEEDSLFELAEDLDNDEIGTDDSFCSSSPVRRISPSIIVDNNHQANTALFLGSPSQIIPHLNEPHQELEAFEPLISPPLTSPESDRSELSPEPTRRSFRMSARRLYRRIRGHHLNRNHPTMVFDPLTVSQIANIFSGSSSEEEIENNAEMIDREDINLFFDFTMTTEESTSSILSTLRPSEGALPIRRDPYPPVTELLRTEPTLRRSLPLTSTPLFLRPDQVFDPTASPSEETPIRLWELATSVFVPSDEDNDPIPHSNSGSKSSVSPQSDSKTSPVRSDLLFKDSDTENRSLFSSPVLPNSMTYVSPASYLINNLISPDNIELVLSLV